MSSNPLQTPNPAAQRWIVLIAVVQSLLLLYAHTAIDENHWLSATPFRLTTWYTLALTVPTALMLLITGQRILLSSFFAVGLLALLGLQAGLAGNNCDPSIGVSCGDVLGPFGFSVAVICFLALPFLQAWQHQGRANCHYLLLFEYAWHNALSLTLAAAFLGLFWILLALWAGLFTLLDIQFFADLFGEKTFFYPISGLVVGVGLAIARTRIELLANIRENSLFWIFKSLTPLLAIITLLFLAAVAFSGIDTLWNTGTAGDLLSWLAITIVVFINAVFLNGETSSPYPKAIRWLVNLSLLSLPIISALGLWAISLRVEQYGWTVARLWALLVMLVLLFYGIGYAFAVLRSRDQTTWLSSIKPHNTLMALTIMTVLCLINLGLPNFYQTATNSQLDRLKTEQTSWEEFDFQYLRYSTGLTGYQALQLLDSRLGRELSEAEREKIDQLLLVNDRWQARRDKILAEQELKNRMPDGACPNYGSQQLLGKWYGYHEYDDQTIQQWVIDRKADGSYSAKFDYQYPDTEETHTEEASGLWAYSQCLYTTVTLLSNGEQMSDPQVYRAIELDNIKFVYKLYGSGDRYSVYRSPEQALAAFKKGKQSQPTQNN